MFAAACHFFLQVAGLPLKAAGIFCLCFFLAPACADAVQAPYSPAGESKRFLQTLDNLNARCGWTDVSIDGVAWEHHRITRHRRPLIFARFGAGAGNCILFLGGVHGDERPTVYLMLKLAQYLQEHPLTVKDQCIVIAPLVDPDGYFAAPPTRVNAGGVDLNRNFPTRDWSRNAHRQWRTKGRKNPRYYPGAKAGSEPETLFQTALIKRFQPQKILSVHSPLNFFDYDGPSSDLDSFEQWMETISREANHPLKKFGYYPGSLGNYAGHERNIFTLTLELPSSDPKQGPAYFQQFLPAFLKFIRLPVAGVPPFTRLVKHGKT